MVVKLYAVDINLPVRPDQYNYWIFRMPEEKRRKIEKFLHTADKKRSLYGDVLCRNLVASRLKLDVGDVEMETNSFGKPFVRRQPPVFFNISHSGRWVVCAISDNEVGVDIEEIKPIDMDIARRFFTENEYEAIMAHKESERLDAFYTWWTLKESYIKHIGKGLSIPLNSFEIIKEGGEYHVTAGECPVVMVSWKRLGQYILSVCHSADESCADVCELDIRQFDRTAEMFCGKKA